MRGGHLQERRVHRYDEHDVQHVQHVCFRYLRECSLYVDVGYRVLHVHPD